jgi:hypothetical protein
VTAAALSLLLIVKAILSGVLYLAARIVYNRAPRRRQRIYVLPLFFVAISALLSA